MSEFDLLIMLLFLRNELVLYFWREGSEGGAVYVQRGQVLVEVLVTVEDSNTMQLTSIVVCEVIVGKCDVIAGECDARGRYCDDQRM